MRHSVSSTGTQYIWSEGSDKYRSNHLYSWGSLVRSGLGENSRNREDSKNVPFFRGARDTIDTKSVAVWRTYCAIVDLKVSLRGSRMARRNDRQNNLKVCLLSQHPMVLEEFQRLLARPGIQPRAHRVQAFAVLAGQQGAIPPAHVYVIDSHCPRPVIEKIGRAIQERHPKSPLLFLADQFDQKSAFFLLRLGAKGLLRHADAHDQLLRALRGVAKGGFWVPRKLLSSFVDSVLRAKRGGHGGRWSVQLSRRETQVFESLLDNLSNKEIAAKLRISERTVKFHVSNVLTKFGVGRRADLLMLSDEQPSF